MFFSTATSDLNLFDNVFVSRCLGVNNDFVDESVETLLDCFFCIFHLLSKQDYCLNIEDYL